MENTKTVNITRSALLNMLKKARKDHKLTSNLYDELYTLILFLALKRAKDCKDGECYCYAGDDYFAKKLGISKRHVQRLMNTIKKFGWIKVEAIYKAVQKYSKKKWVSTQVKRGRKIYPVLTVENDSNFESEDKNTINNINKNDTENYAKESPEKKQTENLYTKKISQQEDNYVVGLRPYGQFPLNPLSNKNIGVEGYKNAPNLLVKPSIKEKYKEINKEKKCTNEKIHKEKLSEKSTDWYSDLFSLDLFDKEEATTEIFENSKEQNTENRKKLDNYNFDKKAENAKNVEKPIIQNISLCTINKKEKNSIVEFDKKAKNDFKELVELYYDKNVPIGVEIDTEKAFKEYSRLVYSGEANKYAVISEIRNYTNFLEKTASTRILFGNFLIHGNRKWSVAMRKGKKIEKEYRNKNTGFDYSNEEFLKSIDSFENDVEEDMKKKSLPKKQLEEEFDKAWELYPRKKGKEKARKYFERDRNDGIDFEKILHGVKCYAAEVEKEKIEEEFIKHGSTWFNGKYWADYEGLKLEDFSKQKSNGEKDTEPKVVKESRRCTPEEIREDQESDYEYALRDKEFLGGQWPTSYLRNMPEWVREKEGISKEQLKEWLEHPRNHF